MKDFILVRLIRYVANKFDGYKTKISGLIPFCAGITTFIGLIFPEMAAQYNLPEGSMALVIAEFTAAFGLWGIGGKLEKTKAALVKKK